MTLFTCLTKCVCYLNNEMKYFEFRFYGPILLGPIPVFVKTHFYCSVVVLINFKLYLSYSKLSEIINILIQKSSGTYKVVSHSYFLVS